MLFFDAILRDDVKRVRQLLTSFTVDASVRFGRTKRSLVHVAASVGTCGYGCGCGAVHLDICICCWDVHV